MKTSRKIERRAKRLFRLCQVNGSVDEDRIREVVSRIIAGRHRGYMALLWQFKRLVRLDREAHTAEVGTAAPLPSGLLSSVQARLRYIYGRGMRIHFTTNPDLIGGMRIKAGSDVYDRSVKSELAALERSF